VTATSVEPIPDHPAAAVETGTERVLALADVHAGVERAILADEGIRIDSRAPERRERILGLVERTDPDRLVVLGDLMNSIGDPGGAERGEIEVLVERLPVPVTVVRGNHDGAIEGWLPDAEVTVTDARGIRIGGVGFAHGHTWPAPEVVTADVVCVGHEHPCVRLTDEVGNSRVERAWLRGRLDPSPFDDRSEYEVVEPDGWPDAELVVFPAFNDLSVGAWVNSPDSDFLCPFLPEALENGEAYLVDGTRLGRYDRV
jgi:putative SbcD/Mre11-related phosphoesterase